MATKSKTPKRLLCVSLLAVLAVFAASCGDDIESPTQPNTESQTEPERTTTTTEPAPEPEPETTTPVPPAPEPEPETTTPVPPAPEPEPETTTPVPPAPEPEPETTTPVPPAPDHKVLYGLVIFNDGSLVLELSGLTNSVGLGGCVVASTFTLNDGEYGYHEAWWERDAGSGWQEVAGSRQSGKVCGFDLSSAPPGNYRMVLDATIADERGVYKSLNEITKQ